MSDGPYVGRGRDLFRAIVGPAARLQGEDGDLTGNARLGVSKALLDLGDAPPEIWSNAAEEVIRIRYVRSAETRIQEAVWRLLTELNGAVGVEVAHGRLVRATKAVTDKEDIGD